MLKENIEKVNDKTLPFLRWAGGKRWLTSQIDKYLPSKGFNNYHEPFLGGGAVFFHLKPSKQVYLSDLNNELITTYKCIQDKPYELIDELRKLVNTKEKYYQIRESEPSDNLQLAVKFIYLNYTSFNGIYRVNSNGKYNVPYGYRKKYQIDYGNIISASKILKDVVLNDYDFEQIIPKVNKGDLVFLDPPYTVAHNNNGFVLYNQKIFSLEDQYRLARTINRIKEKGAYYVLTNADHQQIRKIFNNGDKVFRVFRNSNVGGKEARRGRFSELIITNTI